MDPTSHKTLGRNVDARTLKAHTNADRQAALRAAEQNTEATLDSQIEEITAYLSASVLADKVSGPSQNSGGSLWSRLDSVEDYPLQDKSTAATAPARPQPPPYLPAALNLSTDLSHQNPTPASLHSPPRQAGSRRSREAEVLASLADIEVEVDALQRKVIERLTNLIQPSSSGPPIPFPHDDLFPLANDLQSRLDTITVKAPAVLELKGSILRRLQLTKLKAAKAKKTWNEQLSDIKAAKTPGYGLPYETGNTPFAILNV